MAKVKIVKTVIERLYDCKVCGDLSTKETCCNSKGNDCGWWESMNDDCE